MAFLECPDCGTRLPYLSKPHACSTKGRTKDEPRAQTAPGDRSGPRRADRGPRPGDAPAKGDRAKQARPEASPQLPRLAPKPSKGKPLVAHQARRQRDHVQDSVAPTSVGDRQVQQERVSAPKRRDARPSVPPSDSPERKKAKGGLVVRKRGRPKVTGLRPWEVAGLSRRTYYRRQAEKAADDSRT
jgi:hypothetical protein